MESARRNNEYPFVTVDWGENGKTLHAAVASTWGHW